MPPHGKPHAAGSEARTPQQFFLGHRPRGVGRAFLWRGVLPAACLVMAAVNLLFIAALAAAWIAGRLTGRK